MMKLFGCVLVLCALALVCASAEEHTRCRHDERLAKLAVEDPDLHESIMRSKRDMAEEVNNMWLEDSERARAVESSDTVLVLPVMYHYIYHTNEFGVSDEVFNTELKRLNAWFAAKNPHWGKTVEDWHSIRSGDLSIRFVMATKDPDGNDLNPPGIRRVTTGSEFKCGEKEPFGEGKPIDTTKFKNTEYINIAVCESADSLGAASFPNAAGTYQTDAQYLTQAALLSSDDLGYTSAHEMGHWFGVDHPWGDGGCEKDDKINDTPVTDKESDKFTTAGKECPHLCEGGPAACPASSYQRCGHNVPMTLVMDYNKNPCGTMFTNDQRTLMRSWLTKPGTSRNMLLASQKAQGVGVCTPNCQNKACGDNGCGGTCGICSTGLTCKDDQSACFAPAPHNAQCSSAVSLQPESGYIISQTVSTLGATANEACASHGTIYRAAYYKFTGIGRQVKITTCDDATNVDTAIGVYTQSTCGLTQASCNFFNDDVSGCTKGSKERTSTVTLCAAQNTQYIVAVGGARDPNEVAGTFAGKIKISIEVTSDDACTACTPNCENKRCGDNGCGGSCGNCPSGTSCSSNQCTAGAPANDKCDAAIVVTSTSDAPFVHSGSTVASTAGEKGVITGCSDGNPSNGVWYRLNSGTFSGPVKITTCSSNTKFDTQLYVFNECSVSSLSCSGVQFNDDDSSCTMNRQSTIASFTPSGSHYILVTGYDGSAGAYELRIERVGSRRDQIPAIAPPQKTYPQSGRVDKRKKRTRHNNDVYEELFSSTRVIRAAANDQCADAIELDVSGFGDGAIGNLKDATISLAAAQCFPGDATPGLWYKFDAPGGLVIVTVCSEITLADTVIEVYSSTTDCDGMTCVLFNDDAQFECDENPLASEVEICTLIGETYYINVAAYDSDEVGPFEVYAFPAGDCEVPANDDCTNALPLLTGQENFLNSKDFRLSRTLDCSVPPTSRQHRFPLENTAWYTWTPPTPGNQYHFSTCHQETYIEPMVLIYSGSCTDLKCEDYDLFSECDNQYSYYEYYSLGQADFSFCTDPADGTYIVGILPINNEQDDYVLTITDEGSPCTVCVPDCDGRACGDDGCGGECGQCTFLEQCILGQCECVPGECNAFPSFRECGDVGCGVSCGDCNGAQSCIAGHCLEPEQFDNEFCSQGSALPLSAKGGFVYGTNVGRSIPNVDFDCDFELDAGGSWYHLTDLEIGASLILTTCHEETDFDTVLYLFDECNGECFDFGDQDYFCGVNPDASTLIIHSIESTEYFVLVTGFSDEGNFKLSALTSAPSEGIPVLVPNPIPVDNPIPIPVPNPVPVPVIVEVPVDNPVPVQGPPQPVNNPGQATPIQFVDHPVPVPIEVQVPVPVPVPVPVEVIRYRSVSDAARVATSLVLVVCAAVAALM